MPAEKRSAEVESVGSVPPVDSKLLRSHKLRPLRSGHNASPERSNQQQAEDLGQDLPPDLTANPETDLAVDAIAEQEADEALAAQDEVLQTEAVGQQRPIRDFFAAWLGTRRGRRWTLLVLFFCMICLSAVPKTRYWILNTAGVRCGLSVTATDGDTQLALPGVIIRVADNHSQTNRTGFAMLNHLTLGPHTLILERPGFARLREQVTLGWGSNPLGQQTLKDIGQQYIFSVRDYVSGRAVGTASASSNGFSALADQRGKITLTLDNVGAQTLPITISAAGYATKSLTIDSNSTKPTDVSLAPSAKEVYAQAVNGRYNLYSSSVDGQDKQELLAGTPTETSSIALAVSPDSSQVAMVSSRDPNYSSSGQLLMTLDLVNSTDGSVIGIDHAEQIQLIGWIGAAVIYEEQIGTGSTPSYSVISYNYSTDSRDQLATSNQFNGIAITDGLVYYGVPANANATEGFYVVKADGSARQTILAQDIWSVLRTSYSVFDLQTANGWYSFNLGGSSAANLGKGAIPGSLENRQYLESPDGKQSVWINSSGSTPQLIVYNVATGQEHTITTVTGLSYPVRWLNNTDLIYRVTSPLQSVDYVVAVNGGSPKEIGPVTDTTNNGIN